MLNEKAVQDALKSAASRYAEFVQAASHRELYPVQKGEPDNVTLRRVTISCHDSLSLPDDSDMALRLATIRSSADFHMKPLQRGLHISRQIFEEFLS